MTQVIIKYYYYVTLFLILLNSDLFSHCTEISASDKLIFCFCLLISLVWLFIYLMKWGLHQIKVLNVLCSQGELWTSNPLASTCWERGCSRYVWVLVISIHLRDYCVLGKHSANCVISTALLLNLIYLVVEYGVLIWTIF